MAKKLVVPYVRSFRQGAHGKDCLAVKRALRRADQLHRDGNLSDKFGPYAAQALRRFQKRASVKKGVGSYTKPTHTALVKGGHFDAWGAHLMQVAKRASQGTKEEQMRRGIVAWAMFAHSHAPRHYTQDMTGRMEGLTKNIRPPQMWNYADCSGFATWCYWGGTAGKVDPNGWGFLGYPGHDMFTGTMARHGRAVSLEQAKPGDLVIYGDTWPFKHVAVYVGHGRVVSHGHEGGPFLVDARYRSDIAQVRSYL